ncbi:MAG: CxxxxCH/CxxCH domain-containing protein, partial [Geobacteraceae bacterium]|nr:CxxxxCH/CxxCH domain-containing protein [Geobacteraceae bacterium]
MKLRSALLLVLAATVCALGGLISPQVAAASVDAVTQWPALPAIVSNSASGSLTGSFTVGVGNNRLLLVAVATKYTSGTPALTVTYGGSPVTNIAAATNTTGLNKIWVGYQVLGNATATSKANIVVTNTGVAGLTATYVTAAVYNGVNQGSPISGAGAASGSTATLTTANFAVSGIVGNNGLAAFISNFAGATLNTTGTAAKVREYAGANMNIGAGAESVVTNAADNQTVTASAAVSGVLAGIGLTPVTNTGTNYNTVNTCGDCHGYPPQNGTARNVPGGQFAGSHDKHAGGNANQYNMVCTQCHYNNTTYDHSTGYKNISGSSVPGNAYSAGKLIAKTNTPAFGYCNNVSCHSNGRTNPLQYATGLNWGTTDTCLSCHGGRSSAGQNRYTTSANRFKLSTTHGQHLGKYTAAQMNCQICHGKTAASNIALVDYTGATKHANGSKTIYFTNLAYGTYTAYKKSGQGSAGTDQTCRNISCHGGKTRSSWSERSSVNNDNTCVHCHGQATTSAALPNTAANRKFFAPGYGTGVNKGISTDGTASSNDYRVGSHFKHLSSVYMKAIKCNECHRVPSNPFDAGHTDTPRYGNQTLTFAQASTATILIGVAKAGTPSYLTAFAGYTEGTANKAATCSSVYCHGSRMKNGEVGGTYRKPYWNYSAMINYTDKVNACSRCHGYPPTSNSHSASQTCYTCHGAVVDASNNIKDKNLHINGKVEASAHVWSYGGSRHKADATGVYPFTMCNSCHTTATGGTYPPAARNDATLVVCTTCHINSTNFQGSTPGCWDCHGSGAAAANAAPNGNAFPNISGSHSAHMAFAYACSVCHQGGGTGTAVHGNYSSKTAKVKADVVVKLDSAVAGSGAGNTPPSGTVTCSSAVCHGQKSPAWGASVPTAKCLRCHGSQSLGFTNNSAATVAPGGSNIDTGRNTGTTVRGGTHQEHLNASLVTPNKVHCGSCHDATALPGKAINHAQLDNRTTATLTFGYPSKNQGHTPIVTRVGGVITCSATYCHTGKFNSGTGTAPTWNN